MRKLVNASVAISMAKLAGAAALTVVACASHAQTQLAASTPTHAPGMVHTSAARFQDSIDAFAALDRENAPKPGGVLFVGSSSIRMWDKLETQFDELPIIVRRGFGGSRMSDCTHYLQNLVTPYKPRLVVVYAGDNDLSEGATPVEVLKSFAAFVEGVRKELPHTRIAYVSIKPSPLRASLMPVIRETNQLIETYSRTTPNLDYINIYSAMLGPDGQPRHELFRPDELHMNDAGYALWKSIIVSHLR